jgi:hypothetical protein
MIHTPMLPSDCPELPDRLKREIGAARTRAAPAANEELISSTGVSAGRSPLDRHFGYGEL